MPTIYRDDARGKPKAIETVYRGYRFRSRLEARWAVFFDNCRIPGWRYEHEGFDLPSGYYLPDFDFQHPRLPNERAFIEVKPGPAPISVTQDPASWTREILLIAELAERTGASAMRCGIVFGDPYDVFNGAKNTNFLGRWARVDGSFRKIPSEPDYSGPLVEILKPYSIRLDVGSRHMAFGGDILGWTAQDHPEEFERAALIARQARFEHGAQG